MYIVGTSYCLNTSYQPDAEFMPGYEYENLEEFITCALDCLDDFPNIPECVGIARALRAGDYELNEVEPGYFEVTVKYSR